MGARHGTHKGLVALNNQSREVARSKIKVIKIVERLQGHVNGENDMTPTQIKAAEILLKKMLPDLTSADVKTEITTKTVDITADLISKITQLQNSAQLRINNDTAFISQSVPIEEGEFVEVENGESLAP